MEHLRREARVTLRYYQPVVHKPVAKRGACPVRKGGGMATRWVGMAFLVSAALPHVLVRAEGPRGVRGAARRGGRTRLDRHPTVHWTGALTLQQQLRARVRGIGRVQELALPETGPGCVRRSAAANANVVAYVVDFARANVSVRNGCAYAHTRYRAAAVALHECGWVGVRPAPVGTEAAVPAPPPPSFAQCQPCQRVCCIHTAGSALPCTCCLRVPTPCALC